MFKEICDIETIIDYVTNEYEAYENYSLQCKKAHNYDEHKKWKEDCDWKYRTTVDAEAQVSTMTEILCMEPDEINNLYSAARAITHWRKETNYKYLISRELAVKLERYIFKERVVRDPYRWIDKTYQYKKD